MQNAMIWVNGRLFAEGETALDVRDRGLTLGDGVFETIRAHDGVLVRWDAHLARLRSGAAVLGIAVPWTDEELTSIVLHTLVANALRDAVVRLTLSRGVPLARGLLPSTGAVPSLIVHAQPFTPYAPALYERGMRLVTSQIRRNERSPLANIKSLCYLDNVLARVEADRQGADDALMLNTTGDVAGASAANIFAVVDGVTFTPPLAAGALPGTVRAAVLGVLAKQGRAAEERCFTLETLRHADEVVLTNALMGVMPVASVDGQRVGAGSPWALYAMLTDALRLENANTLPSASPVGKQNVTDWCRV